MLYLISYYSLIAEKFCKILMKATILIYIIVDFTLKRKPVTKCSAATSYSPLMQLRSGMFKAHTVEVQVFHKNCYKLNPSNLNVISINLLYGVLSNIMRLLFPNVFVVLY